MLPVTTRPPNRPGAWGSPYGPPTEIDLSRHMYPPPHPEPHASPAAKAKSKWQRTGDWPCPGNNGNGNGPPPPGGPGRFVLPKGCWTVICGPSNQVNLTYMILLDSDRQPQDDVDMGPWDPWRRNVNPRQIPPPPDWKHDPLPPPASNRVMVTVLIKPNTTGVCLADGQNVTIDGDGKVTIIQVFSV
jgi:hypothetical protein